MPGVSEKGALGVGSFGLYEVDVDRLVAVVVVSMGSRLVPERLFHLSGRDRYGLFLLKICYDGLPSIFWLELI